MIRVDAELLWQAVKNASLFSKDKSWNTGEIEFSTQAGLLSVTGSDDHVSVVTTIPVTGAETPRLYLPGADVRRTTKDNPGLESSLRGRTGLIDLDLAMASEEAAEPEWWDEFYKVFASIGQSPGKVQTFEVNPERLSLLSRLEPKGEFPMSWLSCKYDGDQFWAFRYGPRTVGAIIPLDREDLKEHEEWLW